MPDRKLPETDLSLLLHRQIPEEVLADAADQVLGMEHKEYFSLSIAIPSVDVLAVLEQQSERDRFEYYWEKPSDHFAIAAAGELHRIKSTGPDRYKMASKSGKELISRIFHFTRLKHSLAVPHLLGGFSFFDHSVGKYWKEYGAGSFTLPEWLIIKDGNHVILTITLKLKKTDSVSAVKERTHQLLIRLNHICSAETYSIGPDLDQYNHIDVPDGHSREHSRWIHVISKAKEQIKNGTFRKIVLARELAIELDHPVRDTHILNRLRHQYPDCYSFLIRQNRESSFIGCTPERLASFNKDYILTEGLAGSTPRGNTASADAKLESELLKSEKDLREHDFVLQAIRKNLNHYAREIQIPDRPVVRKLSNVQHLYTPVRAKIRHGVSKTEVLKNLHPTPAVGGFPKDKAVPFISHYEDFERGWYAAPIGWINANGDGEFAVAIRSGLILNDEVRFFAGCGIVKESDPEKEWEETNLKFIPMLSALEYAGK